MGKAVDLPLIDHRIYTIAPRKMGDFLNLFADIMPDLAEALGNPVGFYTSVVGQQNQFIHLWAFASMADFEARCKRADNLLRTPAFMAATAPLVVSQESRFICRADLLTPFLVR